MTVTKKQKQTNKIEQVNWLSLYQSDLWYDLRLNDQNEYESNLMLI